MGSRKARQRSSQTCLHFPLFWPFSFPKSFCPNDFANLPWSAFWQGDSFGWTKAGRYRKSKETKEIPNHAAKPVPRSHRLVEDREHGFGLAKKGNDETAIL
jgi:hypothetical protein